MTEQERLSVWYEVSDDDTPTDDDAEQDEHDQLLPAEAPSRSILIGGSSTATGSGRHASLPSSSGPRYQSDKAPLTCIDVTILLLSSACMAVYGVAAYYSMHWRIVYASGASSCTVALDVFLVACAIHAFAMASLLLSYSSRALLSLCRGEAIAPFMESASWTQRATEALLIVGALAQIALGVWGEAWVGAVGLLTAVIHPGTCSVAGTGSLLFSASWYIAAFEFSMMGLVCMYFLLWACTAAHTPSDDPTWLTVSARGAADASSGSGGNRAFSEQLRRTSTPPIIDGTGVTAAPANGNGAASNRHESAFRGASHTLDGQQKAGAATTRDGRPRRERHNRSCS